MEDYKPQRAWLYLALYTGSLKMWEQKSEAGDYCFVHAPKIPRILGISNLSVVPCYK